MNLEEKIKKLEIYLKKYLKTKGKYICGGLVILIALIGITFQAFYSLSGNFFLGNWGFIMFLIQAASAGYSFKLNDERKNELICLEGETEEIAHNLGLHLDMDELSYLLLRGKLQDAVYDVKMQSNKDSKPEPELPISNREEETIAPTYEDISFEDVYSSIRDDFDLPEPPEGSGWKVLITDPTDKSQMIVSDTFYDQHLAPFMDENRGTSRNRKR